MKVLALDQSSRITGWSVFEDGRLLEYGKFDASTVGTDIGKRLAHIQSKVSALIDTHKIDYVVFEEIQLQNTVGNNVTTYKTLAYVQAAIILLLNSRNISYTIVASSSWKSTLGIKGKDRTAQKKAAQEWVIANHNIKPTQDECDAICIGAHYSKNNSVDGFDWAD